jgi:class 3 adenylate cyclase
MCGIPLAYSKCVEIAFNQKQVTPVRGEGLAAPRIFSPVGVRINAPRVANISIRTYAAGLFIVLTLAIGFSLAGLFHERMRSAILSVANVLFDRTATIIAEDVEHEQTQLALSLEFTAISALPGARSLDARLHGLNVLTAVLKANPSVVAAYVGYPNGDFVLLRRRPPPNVSLGPMPATTQFVLQSIERSGSSVRGRYVFYDAQLAPVGGRDDPAYRYDPRTRPWFTARRDATFVTAPYTFFTTKNLGITLSLRTPTASVVGADIDLARLSTDIAKLRPTDSSVAAIVEPGGAVLAYSDPNALAQSQHDAKDDRAPTVAELHSPPLEAALRAIGGDSKPVEGTYRDPAGRPWLYRVSPVLRRPDSLRWLVLSIPEDELLGAADRVRNEAVLLSLVLIVIWIPFTIWLSRFITRPLARLRQDAVALRNSDFSERPPASSIIAEISEFEQTFDSMRRHIREHNEASTRFVPHEFLEQLQRDDIRSLQLGDHAERKMTILFSDIRSFTTLTESMTPQQTFNFVNSYLTRVGPIIRDHGGFIDKYIGDASMGLFPEGPSDALHAAIAMQRRVVLYNEERARAGYAPIAIGIGLHYGDLMLGTIGETLRFETTVIADAVNVAARLESLTKTFGSLILASGQVMDAVDAATHRVRRLSEIQVAGTSRALHVYEICDADAAPALDHKMRTAATFDAGRDAYTAGQFSEARNCFAQVVADDQNDKAARYYHERAEMLETFGSPRGWDGVERMETK